MITAERFSIELIPPTGEKQPVKGDRRIQSCPYPESLSEVNQFPSRGEYNDDSTAIRSRYDCSTSYLTTISLGLYLSVGCCTAA